jgi:hypothetical protein
MKKAKRKIQDDEGHKVSEKCRSEDRGGNQAGRKEGSPRDWPGLNASEQTLNRILSYSARGRRHATKR